MKGGRDDDWAWAILYKAYSYLPQKHRTVGLHGGRPAFSFQLLLKKALGAGSIRCWPDFCHFEAKSRSKSLVHWQTIFGE